VKRILGINKCQTSTYHFEDENVFIYFSESTCGGKPPETYNVPIGTVLEITVYPKVKSKLADLHIDESKFKKERDPHLPEIFAYTNYEEGFSLIVSPNGEVDKFTYFPARNDAHLRCPNYKPPAHPKSEDKQLLSNFLSKMWRGITPLHSTRADVERLIGPPTSPGGFDYALKDEHVFILYSGKGCEKGKKGGWSVPPDTVLSIMVASRKEQKISDLKLNTLETKIIDVLRVS